MKSTKGIGLPQALGFSPARAVQMFGHHKTMIVKPHVDLKPRMAVAPARSSASAKMSWSCMKGCGACCKIGDYDAEVLSGMLKNENDVTEYISMIGEDGWCRHFDSTARNCTIYEERPKFCRVSPEVFKELYEVDEEQLDKFAIDCCIDQIGEIYGTESNEVARFTRLVGIDEHSQKCANE